MYLAQYLIVLHLSNSIIVKAQINPVPIGPIEGPGYQITSLDISSGIYYEYSGEVRRSVSNWRISIFLDIGKQVRHFEDLNYKLNDVKQQCFPKEEWCGVRIKSFPWEDRWEIAADLQRELQRQIEELERTRQNLPILVSSQFRARRSVPLFGFLGKIAGPIAGVLNYEDGEHYEAVMQELNEAQANLSHLVGKQTHVVRSQLESLHSQVQHHDEVLQELHQSFDTLNKELNGQFQHSEFQEYSKLLDKTLAAIKLGLDHSIRATTTMLDAVHDARRGQLHPGILSSEQLGPILDDIRNNATDVIFPIPGPKVSVDELMQVATTSILCEDHKIKILIDIPLLEQDKYAAFKLHPLPTLQGELGNASTRAYVNPAYNYLIVDKEQRTYLLLKDKDWENCRTTTSFHACLKGSPIYDLQNRPICEVSLLTNPTDKVLRTCDIRITSSLESFWKPLRTLAAWLYSVAKPEVLLIICHSAYPIKINITGTGIIRLAPGCSAKTKDIIIPATATQVGQTEILYEPELHLDLKRISSVFSTYSHLTTTMEIQENVRTKLKTPNFDTNSKTLEQLEQELENFAMQRKWRTHHSILIYGSYSGLVIFGIISLLLLCRHSISRKIRTITGKSDFKRNKADPVPETGYKLRNQDEHLDMQRPGKISSTSTNLDQDVELQPSTAEAPKNLVPTTQS
ncbi:uncharacterized protein LOC127291222 [Leptopilina boulardi]|uniref:uncharacterized protein LOC127291222 n=1 Tax=Leptopilina boulardi TaxID=63433 RepID=UPI0021F6691A|nr:uncharacterized protein LOC127291222 [Leptopilina boulardi]